MGSFSIWHWLIVFAIILLLFGVNRIPALGADLAKGIRSFKKELADDQPQQNAAARKALDADQRPRAM